MSKIKEELEAIKEVLEAKKEPSLKGNLNELAKTIPVCPGKPCQYTSPK
ncbi:MAG: hypothetical protein V1679_01585 [Candidatus Peregrinibacteria bacterium]